MNYIYQNHLNGGIYFSDYELNIDQLYCETCGDHDFLIGTADTIDDLIWVLADENYDREYTKEILYEASNGRLSFPSDNWRVTDFDKYPDKYDEEYLCEKFNITCPEPDTCNDCAYIFADEIRNINSDEVLNMEI